MDGVSIWFRLLVTLCRCVLGIKANVGQIAARFVSCDHCHIFKSSGSDSEQHRSALLVTSGFLAVCCSRFKPDDLTM